MAYATVEDLEARWRPLTADEQAKATVLLDDAAVMIDDRVDSPDLAKARIVSCAMVKRAMLGPAESEGVTTTQQTAGPFSQSLSYANPLGNLYISKAERRMLGVRQRAFTVDLMTGEVDNALPEDSDGVG